MMGKQRTLIYKTAIFSLLQILLTSTCVAKEKQPPLSLEEAKHLKFRVSLEGVPFDVPVTYAHSEYVMFKHWPIVPEEQIEGRLRPNVDWIKLTALLPNIDPYTEEKSAEFDRVGWGKKISAGVTHRRVNWDYYFKNFFYRLKRLPDSPGVPLLRYLDTVTKHEVYLSDNKPRDDLVQIICSAPEFDPKPPPSPSCEVVTVFLSRFELRYSFHRDYLNQWPSIDSRLKSRYEEFIRSANSFN